MLRKDYLAGRGIVIDTLPIENQPEEKDVSSIPDLLKIIFAPDERGCLTGDINLFVNSNTNPEIRQFIESQLMNENPHSKGLSLSDDVLNKMRSVITDDDIARFTRNHDEDVNAYAYRIGSYFQKERLDNLSKARYAREKKRLESLGYNFDDFD